jgi:hypothetical protein
MSIESIRAESLVCSCGCGNQFLMFSGLLNYGSASEVAFRIAHLSHQDDGPHLWLLLGSGPWFEDDARGCWLTLHSWVTSESVTAKIEDPEYSPFLAEHVFDERRLSRQEVLSKAGALEWAIERREELLRLHPESWQFLLGDDMPNHSLNTDAPKDGAPVS